MPQTSPPPDGEPTLASLDAVPNNLPVQLTTFVGREHELQAVADLVTVDRLVTLTGPGGGGKTRLAMQTAADLADRWPGGVWWIDLAAITDPDQVAEQVTAALGLLVEPAGGPLRAVERHLRDRRLLLCLDNCEHVLAAAAELAEVVLRGCPEVTILATSREPLGVASESVLGVPALAEDDAVALFVERASRVRPWFTLDGTNEAAIRIMCQRLDGSPLALELAAAWLRTLTPAQIASGLDDRFALLVRSARGVDARQQSLAASMAWSYDLLDSIDQATFRRLSVFAGGFTIDAAQAVCAPAGAGPLGGEVLDSLGRLVDKSLVVVDEGDGQARFRLLETIREYAGARLEEGGEVAATRDRHLHHYLGLVEAAEDVFAQDQDRWRATMSVEHENLRAALDWGLGAADPEPGRRLAAGLAPLWNLRRGGHEGIRFLDRAIARAPEARTMQQARLLTGLALVADTTGPLRLELEAAERGLELATDVGDDRSRARCLLMAGVARFYLDFDAAGAICEEAAKAAELADDAYARDGSQMLRGILLASQSRHDEARSLLEESTGRLCQRADRGMAGTGIGYLVDAAQHTGELRRSAQMAAELVELVEPLGDFYAVGGATGHLAIATGMLGDPEAGRRLMDDLVRGIEAADERVFVPRSSPVLGKLSLWAGRLAEAEGWFERDAQSTDPGADSLIALRALPGLGATLRLLGRIEEAAAVIERAVAIAARLGAAHLLADALEQAAWLAAPDDPDRAEQLHHEALAVRVDRGLRTFYVDSLDGLAALAAGAGNHVDAVRILAASDAAREVMGYARPPVARPAHDALVAELEAALAPAEVAAARAEGAGLCLDEAVAYVRRSRGTRGRPSTGWASLTPTELDVVRLVVEGLTNPEIGARLLMSRGTVKTHLSHVYAKLTVANRTELATLASTRLGLRTPR